MTPALRRFAILSAALLVVSVTTLDLPVATAEQPAIDGGQIVVKLAPSVDAYAFAARWNVEVVDTMLSSRGIYLMSVPFDGSGVKPKDIEKKLEEQVKKAVKELEKSDDVVYAEPNFNLTVSDGRLHLWELTNPESTASASEYQWQPAAFALDLTTAHEFTRGAHTVIAVLDTGIDMDHEAFAGRIVPGYDYIDDDFWPDDVGDGVDSNGDGHIDEGTGHGTRVAGLAHLVAPDAMLMPARILDSEGNGNVYLMAEAINEVVDAGADVINISAGTKSEKTSRVLSDAIKFADEQGVIVVAAAGNSGNGSKTYPASDDRVISVGTISRGYAYTPHLAWFSNHGKWVTVATAGVDLVTVTPGGYGRASGTSMSSPIVAGGVALLRSLDSHSKAKDVTKTLEESTQKLGSGPKVERGAVDIIKALDRIS